MAWDAEMAGLFHDRDNQPQIGPQIGEVISAEPLRISLQNGVWILEAGQILLCAAIAEHQPRTAAVSIDPAQADLQTINETGSLAGTGTITFTGILKEGDRVLCIPVSTLPGKAQKFAVIDRVVQNVPTV